MELLKNVGKSQSIESSDDDNYVPEEAGGSGGCSAGGGGRLNQCCEGGKEHATCIESCTSVGGCYMISSHSRRASLSPHTPACNRARTLCMPHAAVAPSADTEAGVLLHQVSHGGEACPTHGRRGVDRSQRRVAGRVVVAGRVAVRSRLGAARCQRPQQELVVPRGAVRCGRVGSAATVSEGLCAGVWGGRRTHRGRRAGMTDSAGKQQRRRRRWRPGRALGRRASGNACTARQ
jgi:hypothetical protein